MEILGFILVAVYAGYHLLVFLRPEILEPTASLVLSALMCGFFVIFADREKKFDLLSPPRLLAVLYLLLFPIFGLVYLQLSDLEKWYFRFVVDKDFPRTVALTVFYTTITLPLFRYGYQLGRRMHLPAGRLLFVREKLPGSFRLVCVCFLFTLIGAICLRQYVKEVGGLSYMMETMSVRSQWRGQANPAYSQISLFLISAPAVLFLYALYTSKRLLLLAAGGLVFVSSALMAASGTRERAAMAMVLIAMTSFFYWRRNPKRFWQISGQLFLLACACVVVFGAIAFVMTTHRNIAAQGGGGMIGILADFNRIDVSASAFRQYIGKNTSYELGVPFLAIFSPIFTYLFHWQPIPTTPELLWQSVMMGKGFGTPGCPFAAELYINFGPVGCVLFFVAGVFFGVYYRGLQLSNYTFWNTILYSYVLYLFTFRICMMNGLSVSTYRLVIVVQLLLIWLVSTIRVGGTGPTLRPNPRRPALQTARKPLLEVHRFE